MDSQQTPDDNPPPTSNAQLATLLAETYREAETLRRELAAMRKRVEKAERMVQALSSDPTGSPSATTNGTPQDQHAETTKRLVDEYEERLAQAETARDTAEARTRLGQDSWDQVERYLAQLDSRAIDARKAYSTIINGGQSMLSHLVPPPPFGHGSAMAPPTVPSRSQSRQQSTRTLGFPALPPHPSTSAAPAPSSAGSRRPRTPSLEGLYNAAQPPSKRSRGNAEDQRGREPRPSYSEPYLPQHQHSTGDRNYQQEQLLLRLQQQQAAHRHPEPRVIERKYTSGHAHGSHSSSSSIDVDEMLLRASTGGNEQVDARRRDEESPRPHQAITTATNPYPTQVPASTTYPANQSTPGSANANRGQGQYQVHVFTPIVTGAPTKKSKYPNTSQVGSVGLAGSASLETPQPTSGPITPYASTNAAGQRICRQCGMVGRYKDGKCVEKWGPGPMGPGTVCDRCRKKMKRVERRGTLENQQHLLAAQQQQQQPQLQPRSNSHAQLPLPPSSQSSDRSIQRTDTILNQSTQGFSQSTSRIEREDTSTRSGAHHPHSHSHSALSSKRHLVSPPPSIASLREPREEEDEEHDTDRDQLPTSNVGRGSAANSRSASRNGHGHGRRSGPPLRPTPPISGSDSAGAPTKRSPLGSGGGKGSISPQHADADEMDADADADAEAEAEAEILGAVDAAHEVGEDDDGEGEGEGEGEGDGDGEGDADAELLEAVDAAEANSSSSHGGT